jgi:hypothetical protein
MRALVALSALALASCAAVLGLTDPALDESISPEGGPPDDRDAGADATNGDDARTEGGDASVPSEPGTPIWAVRFGGENVHIPVGCDAAGNIFVAIRFVGNDRQFGSFTLTSEARDIAVLKIAADGSKVLWASTIGGVADETPRALSVDQNGDVYVAGELESAQATVTGGVVLDRGSRDVPQGFIAKLDGDTGAGKWGTVFQLSSGTSSVDRADCVAIRATVDGVAFGCRYYGAAAFPDLSLANQNRTSSVFGLMHPTSGAVVWGVVLASTQASNGTFTNESVLLNAVDIDATGVYAVGQSYATAMTYDGQNIVGSARRGLHGAFVVKGFNGGAAGMPFQWARMFGPIGGETGQANARRVRVDSSGAVHVGGTFAGASNFGTTSITAVNDDAFVVKLDKSGPYQWAKPISGPGNERFGSIFFDPSGAPVAFVDMAGVPAGSMLDGKPLAANNIFAGAGLDPANGNARWVTSRAASTSIELYDATTCGAGFVGTALFTGSIDLGTTLTSVQSTGDIAVFGMKP